MRKSNPGVVLQCCTCLALETVKQPRTTHPKPTDLNGGVMYRLRTQNATVFIATLVITTARFATEQQACLVIWNHRQEGVPNFV
jgi:hypothetical protein